MNNESPNLRSVMSYGESFDGYENTWRTPIDQDCMNLDLALGRWLGERLVYLSKHTKSYPISYENYLAFQIHCLKYGKALIRYSQKYGSGDEGKVNRVQEAREALRWVAQYFEQLWDVEVKKENQEYQQTTGVGS